MGRAALGAVFAAAFAAGLLAWLPLSTALSAAGAARFGLSAADVRGTVWSGRLEDAQIGRLALGDVRLGLSPGAFLAGVVGLDVKLAGAVAGRATLWTETGGWGLSGADLAMPLGLIGHPAFARGEVRLEDARIEMRRGACARADGRIATDALARFGELAQWDAPELTGPLSCAEDGAAQAELLGADARAETRAVVRLFADGRYRIETSVRTSDPALTAALGAAGFALGPDGFVAVMEGQAGHAPAS